MNILEAFKIKRITKFTQLILLDEQGFIVDSCDAIFSTENYKSQPVFKWFPIIESIFNELMQLNLDESELRFAKVEKPTDFLPGYYDFNFSKVTYENQELILWTIYDFTSLYEDFLQHQQRANELAIQRELKASIKTAKESQNGSSVPFESTLNPGYHKYKKSVLDIIQSPLNLLDGFSFSLKNNYASSGLDYLSKLKASLGSLRNVVEEFEDFSSQFSSDFTSIQEQMFPIAELCQQILSKVSKEQSQAGKIFNYHIDDSLPIQAIGFPGPFAQILFYLASNSIKFDQVIKVEFNIDSQLSEKKESLKIELRLLEKLNNNISLLHLNNNHKEQDIAFSFRLSLIKKLVAIVEGSIQANYLQKDNALLISCTLPLKKIAS